MTPAAAIATVLGYVALMFAISFISSRGSDNLSFFRGTRRSSWLTVSVSMISSVMSGVTFVSVPGWVGTSGMGYLQMCIGFAAGYAVIAYVLVPLYFRLDVVSVYQYLEQRFGLASYKTGAWFFFISKLLGSSVKLFIVCLSLQMLVFGPLGLPFALNAASCTAIIFIYTLGSGVKSLIRTDLLRTFCMVAAVTLTIYFIAKKLDMNIVSAITGSSMSRIFHFDDPLSGQYFWKQFLGGLFTVVAMTGLDQDMMQHTLSCKSSRDSQKNLMTSIFFQIIVIFLFLCLGVLLHMFAQAEGIDAKGDALFPAVATGGYLPSIVGVLFILGLSASSFGAGGSALTALTTSFTVDIAGIEGKDESSVKRLRRRVHLSMALLMGITVLVFSAVNSTSAIDAIYCIASYTYGPLLGLFAFGIATKKKVHDKFVPLVALSAPAICYILDHNSERWFGGYHFSYELLIINAAITILGLALIIKR